MKFCPRYAKTKITKSITRFVEHGEKIGRLKVSGTYLDLFGGDRHKNDFLENDEFALEWGEKRMDETLLYLYNSFEQ